MSKANLRTALQAVLATIPLVLGAAPLGVIFGALCISNGYSPLFAVLMSAIVFAGSAQFIVIGLMALNTPISVILLTTFIVNLRHALYGMTLVPYLRKEPLWVRFIIGFGLTDESFAVAAAKFDDKKINLKAYFFGSMALFYSSWVGSTYLGSVLGTSFPQLAKMKLEIAMLVTFIGMVVPYLKMRSGQIAILITAISSIVFYPLPYKLGLVLSTLLGVSSGYLYLRRRKVIYG